MKLPVFAIYLDTKKLATYTVLAFILGGLLGGAMWNFGGVFVPEPLSSASVGFGTLDRFTSYDELKNFLGTMTSLWGVNIYFDSLIPRSPNFKIGIASTAKTAADSAKAASDAASVTGYGFADYSGTNIQVEGVDEADIVKTDGEYIYLVVEDTVVIVRAYPPEEAGIVARIKLYQWVIDMFVSGDKLVVFLQISPDVYYEILGTEPPTDFEPKTTIIVYDITDRGSPQKEREITVDGFYFNSRMIGDYVYAIVRKQAMISEDEVLLPTLSSESVRKMTFGIVTERRWWKVEPTEVYYINQTDSGFCFTNVLAVNAQDPEEPITLETFLLGEAANLYVSLRNIYIAAWQSQGRTKIYKIAIDEGEISYVADGSVPGLLLNQFSMDEHDGYFRVATTDGRVSRSGSSSSSSVYVLNETLGIVGSLEGLAPGEQIYSARFMGERCYLVTFKKVDPLFAIDLSDPFEPRVLGKLKIPGYSDYLHPYDEDHLIGFGKETVEAEEGDFAWYQGVKISIFDVSNVSAPVELAKIVIGDRGTDSPALRDHKAFLFSRARNLLVIPILVAEIDESRYSGPILPPNMHGEYVFQGAYVFDVSLDSGIMVRGRITHLDGVDDLLKSGYWFESEYSVERSLYIEDTLYTISGRMIKMNSLEDLSEVGRVDIS
ncbi:MAG: beta-propeller domain-containing protein [Candidatus Bathyarchaeota archaeon]|nr:beta-propeller domain-containing protein [Candidatus Bathyarchaeota archaeon]